MPMSNDKRWDSPIADRIKDLGNIVPVFFFIYNRLIETSRRFGQRED